MNQHSKELNIDTDLKEPRSSASSTYSSDSIKHTIQESNKTQSQTSRNLLSVIKQGIRRSRSPSPAPPSNTSRATTPTPANPQPRKALSSSLQSPAATASGSMYNNNPRTVSMSTTSSYSSAMTATSSEGYPASPKRSSTGQSDFERMAYGRHSSEWLFGNHSITGAFKKAVSKKRDST